MDSIDQGEQLRIALQFGSKLMEGAQPLFGLADEMGIVLVDEEAGRVVYMTDIESGLLQLLTEEHVFIAVVTEPLVEGMVDDDVATDYEVAGVEMLEWTFPAFLRPVLGFTGFLIAIAQIG
jgi:hypothetical protein